MAEVKNANPSGRPNRASSVFDAENLFRGFNALPGPADVDLEQKLERVGQNVFNRDELLERGRQVISDALRVTTREAARSVLEGAAEQSGVSLPEWIDLIGEMARDGNHPEAKLEELTQMFTELDQNKDARVDEKEVSRVLADDDLLDKLKGINATVSKLIRDPNFRVRVIKRTPYQSIYGPRPEGQVSLVETGVASFLETANQFNVSFD